MGSRPPRLRGFGEQCEIEALDGFAPFGGQLGADAPFVFQTRNFMAAGAAEVANPFFAFVFELGVVHERSIAVGRRFLLLQGDR